MVAKVPGVVARVLLGYPEWLLRCCYAAAKVPGVVAKVLLGSCNGTRVVARCFYAVANVPRVISRVLLGYPG